MAEDGKQFVDESIERSLKEDPAFAEFYEKGRLRRMLAMAFVRLRRASGLTMQTLSEKLGWEPLKAFNLERGDLDVLSALNRVATFVSANEAGAILLFIDRKSGKVISGSALSNDPQVEEFVRTAEGMTFGSGQAEK